MKKCVRHMVGIVIALAYILIGARRRCLARYSKPGTVLSLFGHNPNPRVLGALLDWFLKRGFSFVSSDDLIEMRQGRMPWRPKTAWLTFDDGWAGFESQLLPILRKYNVPATIFVPPNEINRGHVWTNSVAGRVPMTIRKGWYDLPAAERYAQVDKVLSEKPDREPVGGALSSKEELCRLAKNGLVTLENHTYTHLSCSHRPVSEVVSEIEITQGEIKRWTGRTPRFVCYPFGHWNASVDKAIRDKGLITVKCTPGVMTLETLGECRNMFGDSLPLLENVGRVLGAWPKVRVRVD